jgi:2-hydroxyacyl-CoA lyase 1
MARVSGGEIAAKQLKREGIEVGFNLPGDPMGSLTSGLTKEGIRLINFRHEQGNALAAQAYGYSLRRPALAIAASGPAMTNAITGLATAWANTWPFLLIGGNGTMALRYRGDFQEMPQVEAAAPFCKWSVAIDDPRQAAYYVNAAIRKMMNGRPLPVYLDMPADVLDARVEEDEVRYYPPVGQPARPAAAQEDVRRAIQAITQAKRPLLLVGKGLAWSDAAEETTQLAERLNIPFIPSPMGKGVIPDDHRLNASAARSYALQNADLVILAGARFNWIFHFGQAPRFAKDVKVIQLDIEANEIGNGVPADVGLVGDGKVVIKQMLDELGRRTASRESDWLLSLEAAKKKNADAIAPMVNSQDSPMNHYQMFREIMPMLDRDVTICADGENTMAISRTMAPNYLPRHRLDAGESGCMGVAVPYGLGAQAANPGKQVVVFGGDYSFGWNGFEAETAVRNKLPVVFVVANNVSVGGPQARELGGGGMGIGGQPEGIRYDKIMEAFGGHAEHVETVQQLRPAMERALASGKASLLNVVISTGRARKEQEFNWMSNRANRMHY